MNRRTFTTIVVLLYFSLTAPLFAQVTIGSEINPAKGALLDLKQETTTTKGLGLPRVKLTNLNPTTPAELAASIGSTGQWGLAEHTGLLVYNVENQCSLSQTISKGIYIWNGTDWQTISSLPSTVYKYTDQRDGETYMVGKFPGDVGDWMLENIRYNPITNPATGFTGFTEGATGDPSILPTDKYFCYPSIDGSYNSATMKANWLPKYGLLYNFTAATNGQNNSTDNQGQGEATQGPATPIQGICPSGWHIPSDKEWNDLERQIYQNAYLYSSYTQADINSWETWQAAWETGDTSGILRPNSSSDGHGKAMKSPCEIPNNPRGEPNGNSLSTTEGGFDILLVGNANSNLVGGTGYYSGFWTSSKHDGDKTWRRQVNYTDPRVSRAYAENWNLFSVRCKKD